MGDGARCSRIIVTPDRTLSPKGIIGRQRLLIELAFSGVQKNMLQLFLSCEIDNKKGGTGGQG